MAKPALRRQLFIVSLMSLVGCKTPWSGGSRSQVNATNSDYIKLKEFNYETTDTSLRSLGARIGCQEAAQWMLYPSGGSLQKTISSLYQSQKPYDNLMSELFDYSKAEQRCKANPLPPRNDQTFGMSKLLEQLKSKNMGLTFVMVGGFGSHLTENGALSDSRQLWQDKFGADANYFRVIRHECEPNSFAPDDSCSPLVIKRFNELEKSRGAIEHRYLFWGYSKGGNTLLQALATSPEMREKTLAVTTVGSPIGGGLPTEVVLPALDQFAQKKSQATSTDRDSLNHLLSFGAGVQINNRTPGMAAKFTAMLEEKEFGIVRSGFQSITPSVRKKFIYEKMKQWDFTRHNADPLTGKKELPIFHVVSALDVARLTPIPVMTVNNDGEIVADTTSQSPAQLAELAMLTSFRNNPLSDSCVAIQHAVIPKNAIPRGASPQLLAIMNLDHMSLGFSKSGLQEKRSMPRVEIVDALIDSMLLELKVLK